MKNPFSQQPDPDLVCWRAIVDDGPRREWGCTQLYLRYSERITKLFVRSDLSDVEVEELVHDVFVKMIQGAATFTPDQKFKRWLYSIAHNVLCDHLEQTRKQAALDLTSEDIDSLVELAYGTQRHGNLALVNCVQDSLNTFELMHPERAFFVQLAVLEGYSGKELAQMLKREEGAARQYIYDCRKRFKPFLERCRIYLSMEGL